MVGIVLGISFFTNHSCFVEISVEWLWVVLTVATSYSGKFELVIHYMSDCKVSGWNCRQICSKKASILCGFVKFDIHNYCDFVYFYLHSED